MDLLHLVTRLEELVSEAQKLPIGSRIITDRRKLLDVIDQMRVVIPQEVREAQSIVERDDELRRQAEEEARILVARAEEQARILIDEHQITAAANANALLLEQRANSRLEERIEAANQDIQYRIGESRTAAARQMTDADAYSTELLRRLERQLEAFVRSVRAGLSQLEPALDRDPDAFELPAPPAAAEATDEVELPVVVEDALVPVGAAVAAEHDPVAAAAPEPPAVTPAPLPEVTPIPIRFAAMSSIEELEPEADRDETFDDEPDEPSDDGRDGDEPADDEPVAELENLLARPSVIPGVEPPARAPDPDPEATIIDDLTRPRLDDEGQREED